MQLSYFHYFCIYLEHGMYFLVFQYSIQCPHYVIHCTLTYIVLYSIMQDPIFILPGVSVEKKMQYIMCFSQRKAH